jgi:hypothetical protein
MPESGKSGMAAFGGTFLVVFTSLRYNLRYIQSAVGTCEKANES